MGWFKHAFHSVTHTVSKVASKAEHTAVHAAGGMVHKAENALSNPLGALTGGLPSKLLMAGGVVAAVMLLR